MIVIPIFTAMILLGILIASSNKRKNSELFKKLGRYDYKPITGFSLEELDLLPLNDKIIHEEYENIANMLREKFGITIWSQIDPISFLWKYWFTSKYKGDFLSSNKTYSTKQEAYRDAFIHILKEEFI
jgi:hypothetical protein